jgi:hypothetical protein
MALGGVIGTSYWQDTGPLTDAPAALHNAVLTEPRDYTGVTFTGMTELKFSVGRPQAGPTFTDCAFRNGSYAPGQYALKIASQYRPYARFVNCTFEEAAKLALAQYAWFEGCTFREADDGVFCNYDAEGRINVTVQDCDFTRLGVSPGAHADGVQVAGGRGLVVRQNRFEMADEPPGTPHPAFANACVFIEAKFRKVRDVTVVGNVLKGGNYTVYVWNDRRTPTGLDPKWYPERVWVDYNAPVQGFRFGPFAWNNPAGGGQYIGPNNVVVQ